MPEPEKTIYNYLLVNSVKIIVLGSDVFTHKFDPRLMLILNRTHHFAKVEQNCKI